MGSLAILSTCLTLGIAIKCYKGNSEIGKEVSWEEKECGEGVTQCQNITFDGTGTFGCGTASESKTIGCTELMSKKTCYCEADLCNGAQMNLGSIGIFMSLGVITINIFLE